ncbi:hypothetical protein ACQPW1_22995 [Nocardia sp. CA-128927]|uniref:hypothetical protein n=1 Tax=Nocardia sp. CA-128927 TaxID=3239975 RepID=UPI003D966BC7
MIERLERSRNRFRERRAAAAQREQVVASAVEEYIHAWHAIRGLEQARDDEIAALEQQINTIRQHATSEIATQRRQQALAAVMIREQGHRDDDVADLLEITPKQVRQLIGLVNTATSRAAVSSTTADDGSAVSPDSAPADPLSGIGESAAKQQAERDLPSKGGTAPNSGSANVDIPQSASERDGLV